MLDKSKLYYLCHPYTTHGDMMINKVEAKETEDILAEVIGLKVLNPLRLIECDDNREAMERCLSLLAACDVIILCQDWEKSKGCKEEVSFAINVGKEVILLDDVLTEGDK